MTQRHIRWRTDILYPPDASTPQRVSDLDAIGESLEIVKERKRRIDVNVGRMFEKEGRHVRCGAPGFDFNIGPPPTTS